MSGSLLDLPRPRVDRTWPPSDAEAAETLVADHAPGEAPARWVSGRDDHDDQLWVATERRVLLLAHEFNRRTLGELAYSEIQGVHLAREPTGARIRLYAGGRKWVLECGNPALGEEFIRYVRGWLSQPPGRGPSTVLQSVSEVRLFPGGPQRHWSGSTAAV